jgi:aspartokinase
LTGDDDAFIMAVVQFINQTTLRLCVAVRQNQVAVCRQTLEFQGMAEYGISVRVRQPVDVLFFHGPHFQDRYGIAEAAFRTVNRQRISLHAAGCTGTSIYLVLDGGKGPLAKEMLSESFTVPGPSDSTGVN